MDALQYAEQIAYSSKEVLHFTYEMAVKYKDIPEACYVECGCAAGAQVIALKAGAPFKVVYAFDSFNGLPFPSNKDNQLPGIRMLAEWEQKSLPDPGKALLETTGAVAVPLESFWEHIFNSGVNRVSIITVKGWFEQTVPNVSQQIEPIAILRLDGDLYNSTYTCLKYLYPKVIKGGICIVDDWALPGCQQAVEDYFFEQDLLTPEFRIVENNPGSIVIYWIK